MRIDADILLAALKHPAAGMRHPDIDSAEQAIFGRTRAPPAWIPADGDCIEWARKCGIPDELIEVFELGWPNESTEIGPWSRLWDLQSIRNEMESYPAFLDQGFLVIGSALNGDWIAMDLLQHPGAIGYLGKDQVVRDAIGPRDNLKLVLVEDLRQKFFEISPSLGAFALGVVKDALPIDSFSTWSEENEKASWFEELEDDEDAGHRAS